jgi:hypothetical protein
MGGALTILAKNYSIRPKLQFLIGNKYFGVKLDLNLKLKYFEDHPYNEKECEAYKNKLLAMTEEELINKCSKVATLKAITFKERLPKPDYSYESKKKFWPFTEAVCMVFDMEPDEKLLIALFTQAKDLSTNPALISPLAIRVYKFAVLLAREYPQGLEAVSPCEVLDFAISVGEDPPKALTEAAQAAKEKRLELNTTIFNTTISQSVSTRISAADRSVKYRELSLIIRTENRDLTRKEIATRVFEQLEKSNPIYVTKANGELCSIGTIMRLINQK